MATESIVRNTSDIVIIGTLPADEDAGMDPFSGRTERTPKISPVGGVGIDSISSCTVKAAIKPHAPNVAPVMWEWIRSPIAQWVEPRTPQVTPASLLTEQVWPHLSCHNKKTLGVLSASRTSTTVRQRRNRSGNGRSSDPLFRYCSITVPP